MLYALLLEVLLLAAAGAVEAADWRYSVGIHDYNVPDVDSHTYGIDATVSMDERTESGRHAFASLDLFIDHDQDDLDPDHIPIWWQIHAGTDGDLWRAEHTYVRWTANVDTRMNTVSSIERRITALPAIVVGTDGDTVQASLRAGAGWFFQEIDDDVPKTRGYDRDDFRYSDLGYLAAADLSIKLGQSWSVSGGARQWWNSHEWLLTDYEVALRMEVGHEHSQISGFKLSADFQEYNLDIYARPDVAQPILPWDNDVLIRLSFDTAW
jgi:hypothetical protein